LGNRPLRLVVRHLLPNVVAVVVAQAPISASWAILTTAGLGFLGLGVKIPQAEWGTMISGGAEQMVTGQWWTVVFPGLALVGAVLSLNLVGDALQEWVDPLGDGS
jgi:peptide/nickel transport system permease protein